MILKWDDTLPGAAKAKGNPTSGIDAMFFALTLADGASITDLSFATWGYADASGAVLDEQFRAALPLSEGVAPASNGKWGFVDESGDWIIQPRYSSARPFSEGRAAVETEAGWGFVDKRGAVAIQPQFAHVGFFSEGLCSVWPKSQRKVTANAFFGNAEQGGYIDLTGTAVIRPGDHNTYNLHPFAHGLAMMRGIEGNDPRYINRAGKVILRLNDLELEGVGMFRDGLARVERSGLYASSTPPVGCTSSRSFAMHWISPKDQLWSRRMGSSGATLPRRAAGSSSRSSLT